jgi:hypothetical protein
MACLGVKSVDTNTQIGSFSEGPYEFLDCFKHVQNKTFYTKLPFKLKFGGIRPFQFDSVGKKDYLWLRNPQNLQMAFTAFSGVGLEKFVSKSDYFKPNNDWCCNTEWENKSLNEIVKGFLNSDTNQKGTDYYSKFWQRRRLENNLEETYEILVQIDDLYNQNKTPQAYTQKDTVLTGLLRFNAKLLHAKPNNYNLVCMEYFQFLKQQKLNYSAYKLIRHNPNLKLNTTTKDSLVQSLKTDTLSHSQWVGLNDNSTGWITGTSFRDTNFYTGP